MEFIGVKLFVQPIKLLEISITMRSWNYTCIITLSSLKLVQNFLMYVFVTKSLRFFVK